MAGVQPMGEHFLFTVETPQETTRVLQAYRAGRPLTGMVRRIAATPAHKGEKHE